MRFIWVAFTIPLLVVAANHPTDPRAALIHNYRSWRKVTPGPVDMSPAMVSSCIGPRRWDRAGNPHVPKVFLVYVNPIGEEAMLRSGTTTFPDGTVIVKEKYDRSSLVERENSLVRPSLELPSNAEPELLTVMAKANGTWGFFVADARRNVAQEDGRACMSCHEINRENDFAFRSYVPGARSAPNPWGR